MFSWKSYLPFNTGARLGVTLSKSFFNVEGTANIIELSDKRLSLQIDIPKQSVFFHQIPEMMLSIELEYSGKETGNMACIKFEGTEIIDKNVKIQEFPKLKRVRIDPSVDAEDGDVAFSMRLEKDGRVRFTDISGFDKLAGAIVTVNSA